MLNPEFWLDEELSSISPYARLLYMGLWGICDDNYATFPDRPSWIRIQIFPYESVSIPPLLGELEGIGKIIKFQDNGNDFWFLKNFLKHQRVEKPSKPKYPAFPLKLPDYSPTTPAEEKRREENKEIAKAISSPSEIREVREDTEGKEKQPKKKIDTAAMALRETMYIELEKETGVRPIANVGDYVQIQKALKHMKPSDVLDMLHDAMASRQVHTVRSALTDREIDIKREELL